jgi:hypothetical protein
MNITHISSLFSPQLTAMESCKCRALSGLCFGLVIAGPSYASKLTHVISKETSLTQFRLKEPQKSQAQTGRWPLGTRSFHLRRYVTQNNRGKMAWVWLVHGCTFLGVPVHTLARTWTCMQTTWLSHSWTGAKWNKLAGKQVLLLRNIFIKHTTQKNHTCTLPYKIIVRTFGQPMTQQKHGYSKIKLYGPINGLD